MVSVTLRSGYSENTKRSRETYLFLDHKRPSRFRNVVEALTAEVAEVLRPAEVAVEATAAAAGWRPRVAERRTAVAIMMEKL